MATDKPRVGIRPHQSTRNRFVNLFADAFAAAGWQVGHMPWKPGDVWANDVNILHWPDDIFRPQGYQVWRAPGKVGLMAASRFLFRTRWVWVVHNLTPHDQKTRGTRLWRAFLGQLDGLIFLSDYSREQFLADHPRIRAATVTVRHGDYRTGAAVRPGRYVHPAPGRPLRLQFVGLVRPYKNLEGLIAAVRPLGGLVTVRITGEARDLRMRRQLEQLAQGAGNIELELASDSLAEMEVEGAVDRADAVILPYRRVLNSGAALLALSRNRPVIAPAIGGLVELREEVGHDWVHLYEGELTGEAVRRAADWVRNTPRSSTCPLDRYAWNAVGPQIVDFTTSLLR